MKQQTIIRRVVGVVVILGVVLLSTPGGQAASARAVPAPAPHCGGWSIVPNPNPTDYQNQLAAVAAISATDVWAVGQSEALRGPVVTLIEHWDGTGWTIVPSPNPAISFDALTGVAAVSSSDVWAVGWDTTGPLIEHWDGTAWQSVTSPSVVEGGFTGIAAQSATDIWAVGGQAGDKTLTEHWDGTSWQVVASANVPDSNSLLTSVSVLSPTDVWAVGSHTGHGGHALPYTLIEHWDGQHWQIVSSPNVGGFSPLNGVVALSPQNVWAVGRLGDSTLNEHWDGQRWRVVSPALNGTTYSVVALTATEVWAVGFTVNFIFDTFVEQWNGTQWQQVPSPSVTATTISATNDNDLNGVSASSAHNVWAVGYYDPQGGNTTYTLIEHYC